MISLLRRNRKRGSRSKQSNNNRIEDERNSKKIEEIMYGNPSTAGFARSLGLVPNEENISREVMLVLAGTSDKQSRKSGKTSETEKLEFQCRFCGKGYRWKSTMRRHENLECGDKPPSFQCPECPYKAKQRGNLTVHFKRHHPLKIDKSESSSNICRVASSLENIENLDLALRLQNDLAKFI